MMRVPLKESSLQKLTNDANDALEKDFAAVLCKQKKKGWMRFLCIFPAKPQGMTKEEIAKKIKNLNTYCLTHMEDSYQVHIGRLTGIEIVSEILDRSTLSDLTSMQIVGLVWSTLSCVHHFYIRLKLRDGLLSWTRKCAKYNVVEHFASFD